jgi:hypothetical protein
MSTISADLELLQQWMQMVITQPGGIPADSHALEEVVTRSATLTAAERMAIYCRSYQARLLDCFQAMFPGLRCALGDEIFNRFALDYLSHHPPQSYTLNKLADGFPQHLTETRPREREQWPDFIIDLATLELAFLKVYDGPGVEGRPSSAIQDVGMTDDKRLLETRLAPVCCLRLFTLRYPVHTYMLAARRGERPALPAAARSFIVMTRQHYRVSLHELSSSQYTLLQALDGHNTVAEALDRAGGSRGISIARFREWLRDWIAKGFFESLL